MAYIHDYSILDKDIERMYFDLETINHAAMARQLIRDTKSTINVNALRRYISRYIKENLVDREIVKSNVRLAKEKQKSVDQNRIANKSFREHARIENAVEELGKALIGEYKKHGSLLKKINIGKLKPKAGLSGIGVVQLTDLHGNELIDLPNNKYDFNVLAKRMKLYIGECLSHFKHAKISSVAMFFTGDLLNSDRRLDELLNQSTNRAKASVLMQHLIVQAILEVRDAGYEVFIASVVGNESRMHKEMTFSDQGLSDNYDFVIMAGVKSMLQFANIKGIRYGSIDTSEQVIDVDGKNWLISHDIQRATASQEKTQSTIGRYSLRGTPIDFMIGGHIHATNVTDISARSGSMSGSNSFNEIALNLAGKASHNYYIAKDGRIKTIVCDLQNVDGVAGYIISKELEAYNAKSYDKTRNIETIFKVVI